MSLDTVKITREKDLCVSCGICAAACPTGAISMVYSKGQFLPEINEKCTKCGICLEVCPGIDIHLGKQSESSLISAQRDCLESYTAYSNDIKIRENSASGGIITSLVINLLITRQYDYAFVLPFSRFAGEEAKLIATNDPNKVMEAARSKYIPVSVFNVVEVLKKRDGKKYIIIATGCEIYGIRKYLRKFSIPEDNLLFLGLFCEKTMNFNMLRYFEDRYKNNNEKMTELYFKTKENGGWPGNTKIVFDSGRRAFVDKNVRISLKKYFQLNRCSYCNDKLNCYSDISFGDCYIKNRNNYLGKSNIIIRTKKGRRVFKSQESLFTLTEESIEDIASSQHIDEKKDRCKVNLGQNRNYAYIRLLLFKDKVKNKVCSEAKSLLGKLNNISYIILFCCYSVAHIIKRKTANSKLSGQHIIIVGGELFNKGAQAMTFTVVDQMRTIFPGKNIYLFSGQDYRRPDSEKDIYTFNIMPWDAEIRRSMLGISVKRMLLRKPADKIIENDLRSIIQGAALVIDISGYALSSQWGALSALSYLNNIAIAKNYKVPYFILPQSIGPFSFRIDQKLWLYPLLRMYLKYPTRIFVREKEGLESVKKFSKSNVEYSHDIVLQNRNYNLNNIYSKKINYNFIDIEPHSIGIIPNQRVVERSGDNNLLEIYSTAISTLLESGKIVYLVRHSYEDSDMCREIKGLFSQNDKVKLINEDLNAIELNYLIKQFEFIIASRYHSVVHAYKNGVPAIVIGWATKYKELMDYFRQLEYWCDIRDDLIIDDINRKLIKMTNDWMVESRFLLEQVKNASALNPFCLIKG